MVNGLFSGSSFLFYRTIATLGKALCPVGLESTVRYPCIEVDDVLEISEQTKI